MNYLNIIPEITVIALTIVTMISVVAEHYKLKAIYKQELLAQRTLELIASDRERTRAGMYNVRSN